MPDRFVLLGTKGGPSLWGYNQSPFSNLLVLNGVTNIIDAGYGTTFKLLDAEVNLTAIRRVFITHHHSDHNLDLGPMLYTAWANGLSAIVDVYAPSGGLEYIEGYWASNRFDIQTRIDDEGCADLRKLIIVHEYGAGVILEKPGFRVTALQNKHPPVKESYALKFEFGKTVVFSGDTAYFPALAEFARGADYLVHEVMYAPAIERLAKRFNTGKLLSHLKASHTIAEDVGRIATAANVKTLVLSHFVPGDDAVLTPETWAKAVQTTFSGNIIVGADLLELGI